MYRHGGNRNGSILDDPSTFSVVNVSVKYIEQCSTRVDHMYLMSIIEGFAEHIIIMILITSPIYS